MKSGKVVIMTVFGTHLMKEVSLTQQKGTEAAQWSREEQVYKAIAQSIYQ